MDEKKRVKILGAGLVLVLVMYSMRSAVDGYLMKPIRDLEIKLNTASAENETLQQQQIELQVAQRNLREWKDISLPQNPDDAQRLYREWIHELTLQSGFKSFEVTPGGRTPHKDFSVVGVEIKKAETDLQGLTRFLYLFDQANMLQRISAMKVDSSGAQGNPRLIVSMLVEGMSVAGSEDRVELLPRTVISEKLNESATELVAVPNEAFPDDEPFLIRIDHELLRVESVQADKWKVQRSLHGTRAAAHERNSTVELLPVAWDRREKTLEQYADFVKNSMFTIPSPPRTWNPRLAGVSDTTIKPGEEVKFTARAEGFNPEVGELQFALAEPVEGMSIDAKTGEFRWKPAETLAAGKYTTKVQLTQANNSEVKLDAELTITIKPINAPPELTLPDSALVIIGREFKTTASAKDDGPAESLKFSLGSGTPEGLTIDAKTGMLKWTPARTLTPGKYNVEVKVTDAGEEPKSDSETISLDVQDDNASLTLLSAAVAKDDVWYAWFRNKGTGKTSQLKVGEKLTVSEISVEVVSVDNRFVKLKDAEGIWKLALGDILRDRKLIEPASKPDAPASDVIAPDPVVPTLSETSRTESVEPNTTQIEPSPESTRAATVTPIPEGMPEAGPAVAPTPSETASDVPEVSGN